MNKKEFDDSFDMMCKALNVKVNKYQGLLFWDEFKHKHTKDFTAACLFCGRGTPGKLPFPTTFGDSITAAFEMRQLQEKDKREKEIGHSRQINFTPEERMLANRAANEVSRQIKTGEHFDPEKVKAAGLDPSMDEEIRIKYGNEAPNPARIFGGLFPT
jgi:hypothetical protein